MSRREFHFSEGSSNKFWAITLEGRQHTVQYGRQGTAGQTQTKEFDSPEAASLSAAKLIAEKQKKGYAEVGTDAAAPASTPAVTPAPATPKARKSKAAPDSTETTALETSSSATPSPATSTSVSTPPSSPAVSTSASSTTKPLAASAVVASAEVSLDPPQRTLGLRPEDWHLAAWRNSPPLTRPAFSPFDLASCVARLAKVPDRRGYGWDWEVAQIAASLDPHEADFWLQAMVGEGYSVGKPKDVAKRLVSETFCGEKDPEKLWDVLRLFRGHTTP